jgi:hypothetical protein
MTPFFAPPVFIRDRTLRLAAVCLVLYVFAPVNVLGQNQSSTASLIFKRAPRKVWTEDDLAGLLKPWDLYRIAQEKKSALGAASPVAEELPASSNPETPVPGVVDAPAGPNPVASSPVASEIPAGSGNAVLRAMDPRQFSRFLNLLDTETATWQARLRKIDISGIGVEYQEQEEIQRRYNSCQDALEKARSEVVQLTQGQALKLDLLLLIDLNSLARNLDGLSVNLASPLTAQDMSAAHESLAWAMEVLHMDEELARLINDFQYYALTFAGLRDEALETGQQTVGQTK